ncbi:hypothetical protein RRG08_038432 [Elysia crispata]|uniref:Uncharacterized protein n=1 Tax=Elysia crispata TaxID=231223 RepID=A0AAE1E113_9GAST|nr:hypothetical protein RRG08_038432 [Elysia crispata]
MAESSYLHFRIIETFSHIHCFSTIFSLTQPSSRVSRGTQCWKYFPVAGSSAEFSSHHLQPCPARAGVDTSGYQAAQYSESVNSIKKHIRSQTCGDDVAQT